MKKITIATLLVSLSNITLGQQYLCIGDLATGFSFNESINQWQRSSFSVDDSRYVVSRDENSSGDVNNYVVKRIGEDFILATCSNDFSEAGSMTCRNGFNTFNINRENGRFMHVFSFGYWTVLSRNENDPFQDFLGIYDEAANTPYIEIGKCSPF